MMGDSKISPWRRLRFGPPSGNRRRGCSSDVAVELHQPAPLVDQADAQRLVVRRTARRSGNSAAPPAADRGNHIGADRRPGSCRAAPRTGERSAARRRARCRRQRPARRRRRSPVPWTRASVGLGRNASVRIIPASARASRKFSASEYPATRCIQSRSAPAEKLFPRPASTTTRTSRRPRRAARSARVSSAMTVSLKALWTPGGSARGLRRHPCGRSSGSRTRHRSFEPLYIRNTPKRVSSIGALSAAEMPSAEHPARVGRVDDAVVPQPRAWRNRDGPASRTARGSAP